MTNMYLIELTSCTDKGKPIFINLEQVTAIYPMPEFDLWGTSYKFPDSDKPDGNPTCIAMNNGTVYTVSETYDEIYNIIDEDIRSMESE